MLIDVLTAAVLVFVGTRLAQGARATLTQPEIRQRVGVIVAGVRPAHVLLAPVALAAVIAAAVALLAVPGLDFGWWTAIGGLGNPVTGITDSTAGSSLWWVIPAAFLTLLLPALPLFAEREERMFRRGAEHWSTARRARRAVEFGLVHAIIGIPIGVALALSVGGGYFTWWYLRGYRHAGPEHALLEATRAHLVYNVEVLALVALALTFGW